MFLELTHEIMVDAIENTYPPSSMFCELIKKQLIDVRGQDPDVIWNQITLEKMKIIDLLDLYNRIKSSRRR